MTDEKNITAIWEEDDDLMRLKLFYSHTQAEDELKQRIKEKTLSKITDTDKHVTADNHSREDIQQTAEKQDHSPMMTEPLRTTNEEIIRPRRKWLKNKKWTSIVISTAAVVLLAVFLGTNGFLMGEKSNVLISQTDDQATNSKAEESFRGSDNIGVAPDATVPPTTGIAATSDGDSDGNNESKSMDIAAPQKKQSAGTNETTTTGEGAEQKIIYSLDVSLKAKDVTAAAQALEAKAKELGGYVVDSNVSNYDNAVSAYMTLRIPAKHYEAFKSGLPQYGTVDSQHQSTEDVTMAYYDTETRLRSWEAQEKRYLQILEKANTVEDILKIEGSLATVRQEIEVLKGQLKYWDTRVDYSQVTINIQPFQTELSVKDPWQPISLINTLIAIKNALIKTVSFLWNALNYVLVFIAYALPVVIILLVIWLIYRSVRKRKGTREQILEKTMEITMENTIENTSFESQDDPLKTVKKD
ncbi:DUF4349 domain-containing protein [Dehalobacter sp. DCM]|uniref:DUF4349 domain-containing protein n=1 Tax=Dehalobacter sp. DCM TaxID=2907827 RepID=UPI0030813B2E|nr:DUF4349 domain-containing protein [Dehalobacter sp. DCM]